MKKMYFLIISKTQTVPYLHATSVNPVVKSNNNFLTVAGNSYLNIKIPTLQYIDKATNHCETKHTIIICSYIVWNAMLFLFFSFFLLNCSFFFSYVNAWAACSISDKWVYCPPVKGWTCLQDISRAASSHWSPAAMTVTRTSSSRELMASDKCVMGELSGPEVHGNSFYQRESLYIGFYFIWLIWAMHQKNHRGRIYRWINLD